MNLSTKERNQAAGDMISATSDSESRFKDEKTHNGFEEDEEDLDNEELEEEDDYDDEEDTSISSHEEGDDKEDSGTMVEGLSLANEIEDGIGDYDPTKGGDDSNSDDCGDEEDQRGGSTSEDIEQETDSQNLDAKLMQSDGKQAKQVFRVQLVVFAMFVFNATVVIAATWFFLQNSEQVEFETAFNRAAQTISDSTHYHAQNLISSMTSFSEQITTHIASSSSDVDLPCVTLPYFEQNAIHVRYQSFLDLLAFGPLVNGKDQSKWEDYVQQEKGWIHESYQAEAQRIIDPPFQGFDMGHTTVSSEFWDRNLNDLVFPHIYHLNNAQKQEDGTHHNHGDDTHRHSHEEEEKANHGDFISPIPYTNNSSAQPPPQRFAPIWQFSPPPPVDAISMTNADLLSSNLMKKLFLTMQDLDHLVVSEVVDLHDYNIATPSSGEKRHQLLDLLSRPNHHYGHSHHDDIPSVLTFDRPRNTMKSPASIILKPVYDNLGEENKTQVGYLLGVLTWETYLSNLFPTEGRKWVYGVVRNTCGQTLTYIIRGRKATFMGNTDLHKNAYKDYSLYTAFEEFDSPVNQSYWKIPDSHCHFSLTIYSSNRFRALHSTNKPLYFTLAIALMFVMTAIVLIGYMWVITRRQHQVMAVAIGTSAVVANMFPANIQNQVLRDATEASKKLHKRNNNKLQTLTQGLLGRGEQGEEVKEAPSKPIADFHPEVSVIFGDIAGFTAWSSTRDPIQVFELLETVYTSFDKIARRRKVFKVDSIGDSFVAAAGLPRPREDHAVVICRFAKDCLAVFNSLVKTMEVSIGPTLSELNMRFGIHSGSVTAGVLRGERSRFQLFGDTVNVASILETTGEPKRIHISQETAELLAVSGRSSWFYPRKHKIETKGKGWLQTYYIHLSKVTRSSTSSRRSSKSNSSDSDYLNVFVADDKSLDTNGSESNTVEGHVQRLIEWNSNQLLILLNRVVLHRKLINDLDGGVVEPSEKTLNDESVKSDMLASDVLMPEYDPRLHPLFSQPQSMVLPSIVQEQMNDFVSTLCATHEKHTFHDFNKASHSAMAMSRFLSHLYSPPVPKEGRQADIEDLQGREIHDRSFGISSDPVVSFAVSLASLILHLDNAGLTNSHQRVTTEISRGSSSAAHRSLEEAWNLLMEESYTGLRKTIFSNNAEKERFRRILGLAVLATDLSNEAVNIGRSAQWERVFGRKMFDAQAKNTKDAKANAFIEAMMQAADAIHTMQHWNVYQQWNESLFEDLYTAYRKGSKQVAINPATSWYEKELSHFDTHVIPVAKRLKCCEAFGAYSNEYLTVAMQNRSQWASQGRDIVKNLVKKYKYKCQERDGGKRTDSYDTSSSTSQVIGNVASQLLHLSKNEFHLDNSDHSNFTPSVYSTYSTKSVKSILKKSQLDHHSDDGMSLASTGTKKSQRSVRWKSDVKEPVAERPTRKKSKPRRSRSAPETHKTPPESRWGDNSGGSSSSQRRASDPESHGCSGRPGPVIRQPTRRLSPQNSERTNSNSELSLLDDTGWSVHPKSVDSCFDDNTGWSINQTSVDS